MDVGLFGGASWKAGHGETMVVVGWPWYTMEMGHVHSNRSSFELEGTKLPNEIPAIY